MTPIEELWLTQLTLTGREVSLASNASAMHRWVMSLFPEDLGDQARSSAGVLYRLDPINASTMRLLIQSRLHPKTGEADNARTISLLPLLNRLEEGMTLHYRIAANPTKAARDLQNRTVRGKRKALYGADAEKWWRDKATEAGLSVSILDRRRHDLASDRSTRKSDRKEKKVLNNGMRFEGIAAVTDPHRLRTAVAEGIGRGRAYGLGMLSLAPTGG